MKTVRALLVIPPTGLYVREDRCQAPVAKMIAPTVRPPVDLGIMAAILRRLGYQPTVRDYPVEGGGWRRLRADLLDLSPDLLVASTTTPTLHKDLRAFQVAKALRPGVLTVAKGAHFITDATAVMAGAPDLDAAIRGECEETIAEIGAGAPLSAVRGLCLRDKDRIVETPDRPMISKLDEIPSPARDLIRNRLYTRPDTGEPQTTVLASRGCPQGCIFCLAAPLHGRPWRARSPMRIVEEVSECVRSFGIRNIYFQADSFTLMRPWLLNLCEALNRSGLGVQWVCNSRADSLDEEVVMRMKEAGCWGVALGLESGSREILEKVGKGLDLASARRGVTLCKEAGLRTSLMFMIGFPWDTKKSIARTVRFAETLSGDVVEFNIAYPFPGTVLHDESVRLGLIDGAPLSGFDFTRPVAGTLRLGPRELARLRTRAFLKIYARPSYVARMLWSAPSPAVAFRYVRFGLSKLVGFLK